MNAEQRMPPLLTATFLPGPEPRPCPEVLTAEEAVLYLRLNMVDVKDPESTLAYYRRRGLLKGTQIGKCVRYRRVELERFLELVTEANPR